jgi:hypothetical protein
MFLKKDIGRYCDQSTAPIAQADSNRQAHRPSGGLRFFELAVGVPLQVSAWTAWFVFVHNGPSHA